ncbi:MAG: AtpZ/AtpI family protein [Pseudomonadota bacterium]
MSLDDLKTRIATAKQEADGVDAETLRQTSATGNLGQGMRIGIEFVSAIGVSTFIGWTLDQWLGTLPLALIVMFFLGSAAGFLNVYRMATRQEKEATQERDDKNDGGAEHKPDTPTSESD